MKKLSIIVLGCISLALLVTGCTTTSSMSTSASGPGQVLGSPGGGSDNHKIVSFFVIGKGLEPENALTKGEAVILAERAAVADAYRQLVEKVRGVYVDAFMKAGRGTIDYETIQVQTQSWLRGAEVMEITKGEYGITNARVRLRINFAKEGMVWWPVGMGEGSKADISSKAAVSNGSAQI